MKKKVTVEELERQLAEMRERMDALEKRPVFPVTYPVEHHHHYHYDHLYRPQQPYIPWWGGDDLPA